MAHPLVNQHNRTQIGLPMGLFHESSQEMLDDISSGLGIGKNVYFSLTGDNSNQYLRIPNGPPVTSTRDALQSISVYSIDGNKLVDTAKLFKTKTKKLNNINVAFDFFSVVDRPERPLELITYDDIIYLLLLIPLFVQIMMMAGPEHR